LEVEVEEPSVFLMKMMVLVCACACGVRRGWEGVMWVLWLWVLICD